MSRNLAILIIAACIAAIGQWGLMHDLISAHYFFVGWLGWPGFIVSLILGFEGLPGHSPAAPFIQVPVNTVLYFFLIYIVVAGYSKLINRKN
jgi:hypothetical protein